MYNLYRKLENYDTIVIFGVGNLGKLLKDEIELYCGETGKSLCMADNSDSSDKYGYDIPIISPAKAAIEYPNALWIVSSEIHGSSMLNDLRKLNIDDKNIIRKPPAEIVFRDKLRQFHNQYQHLYQHYHEYQNRFLKLQSSTKNELSILCDLYGSDKGSTFGGNVYYKWYAHTYTTIYEYLFSPIRNNVKNVFECGIGTNNETIASSMGISGQPGASLRVWRDYFPNANIWGADIDERILFTENRIQTGYINQTNPNDIKFFFSKFDKNSFDIMIDDGLHTLDAAVSLLENSIDYLSNNGLYIIEDLSLQDIQKFKEYMKGNIALNARYWLMCDMENQGNNLIVLNKINTFQKVV